MRPARLAVTLHCTTCGGKFTLAGVDSHVTYVCVRCDVPVNNPTSASSTATGSSRGGIRYLYAKRARSGGHSWRRPFGRYTLHDEIGRGGMGVVYRAWDGVLQKFVALKVLLSGEHSTNEQVERFLREARAASKVVHENLVKVYDLGWTDDRAYFTMELVDGPTLQEILESRGALPLNETLRIGAAISRALAAAHDSGLVHRDVKPANVLLQVDGTPLLADFGLAADLSEEGGKLTRTGQVLGTPTYMAPEQVTGDHKANPRTDQYGLGAVLFECLAGEPPYTGEEAMAVLQDIVLGPPPTLRERRPTVPKNVALVVETAMARDPMLRYRDARALADDLDRCRRGQPVNANPPSLGYRLRDVFRRNGKMIGGGVGSAVVLLAVLQITAMTLSSMDLRAEERKEAHAESEFAALIEGFGERDASAPQKLADFAASNAAKGTSVETDALLMRAQLLEDSDSSDASAAWADAYISARDQARIERALRGLGGQLRGSAGASREGVQAVALGVAVEQLVATNRAVLADPEVIRWQAESLANSGSWGEAAQLLRDKQPEAAHLLSALSPSIPAPMLDGVVLSADTNSDGIDEIWAVHTNELVCIEPIGLTVSERYPFPQTVVPSQVQLVMLDHFGVKTAVIVAGVSSDDGTSGVRVYRISDAELVEEMAWDDGIVMSAAGVDLDRNGIDELWIGIGPYGRRLVRLIPRGEGQWSRGDTIDTIDAAWSDITSLAAADTDNDGYDELLVTLAAWGGYDVRVLNGADAHPVVSARKKMGHLSNLHPLDDGSFWVAKSDAAPSRVMFPENSPYGDPSGIYRLAAADGELSAVAFLPTPPWHGEHPPLIQTLVSADLDGDRVEDIVYSLLGEQYSAMVLVPGGDPARGSLLLTGIRPILALQADADPQQELLVALGAEGASFLLGVGSEPLPIRLATREPGAAIDGTLPQELQRRWSRVESLVQMGLFDSASREMDRMIGSGSRAPMLRRAAEIAEMAGRDERAASLYRSIAEATKDPLLRAKAVRNFLRAHRFDLADEISQSLTTGPSPLTDLLAATNTARMSFERALPLELSIHDPGAVQMDPRAQGLRTTILSDDGDVISVPFHWSGERLGLDVTLELQRLEWASGIQFSLRHLDETLSISLGGRGGGMILERTTSCDASFGDHTAKHSVRASPSEKVIVKLSLDFARITGDVRCSYTIDGRESHDNLISTRLPPGGEWELVISPAGSGNVEGALASAVIREIELRATDLQIHEPDPNFAWGALLASGIIPEELPENMGVWHALALADAGRAEEAERVLRASIYEEGAEREIAHGLRNQLATFGPVVQTVWPDRYHALFERAYSTAITAHQDDETLMRALINGLPAALDARASRKIGKERAARLFAARGKAWALLGQPAAARRDLTSATRMGSSDHEPRGPVSSAWLGLAALAAVDGDTDKAIEAITQALSASAAPELTADMVRITPELAPYIEAWSLLLP